MERIAIDVSVLTPFLIKKIMYDEYNIEVQKVSTINRGSANIYELWSLKEHLILKELQAGISIGRINTEYSIIQYLYKNGVKVPKYVLTKSGSIFCEYFKRLIIVQYYIDGFVSGFNDSSQEQIIESVCLYGKILQVLETYPYELPTFKKHHMSKSIVEKDISTIKKLQLLSHDYQISLALTHKLEILQNIKFHDYSWQKKITLKKSHGDYNVFQFIYDSDNKIVGVLDFLSARNIPIVRELIRNYFFMAKEIQFGNFDTAFFLEYIRVFISYYPLNYYDLKYMPLVYFLELSKTVYGYSHYLNDGITGYLYYANQLYNQLKIIEKNGKTISNSLLQLL